MTAVPVLEGAARPLLFAHRGLAGRAPENTISAFRHAADAGLPGVELDVRISRDGKVVVIHDAYTGRVAPNQGGAGSGLPVEESDYGELAGLRLAGEDPMESERIPLLAEVLEEFGDALYYDIELKCDHVRSSGLERAVAEQLRGRTGGVDLSTRCIVSSFNPFALARFRVLATGIPLALIWTRQRELPRLLRNGQGRVIVHADLYKPELSSLSLSAAAAWRRRRKPFIPWLVNDPETARSLIAQGCEGLISGWGPEMRAALGFFTGLGRSGL